MHMPSKKCLIIPDTDETLPFPAGVDGDDPACFKYSNSSVIFEARACMDTKVCALTQIQSDLFSWKNEALRASHCSRTYLLLVPGHCQKQKWS